MRNGVHKDYLKGTRRRYLGSGFPMSRFLESRVGRPWDDVYSEITQQFKAKSYERYQLDRNLEFEVEQNCWIGESGTVYDCHGNWPLHNTLYVHPFTRLLCFADKNQPTRGERPVTRIPVGELACYEKIEGIWYFLRYDTVEDKRFGTNLHKKQLGKKDLRLLRLEND